MQSTSPAYHWTCAAQAFTHSLTSLTLHSASTIKNRQPGPALDVFLTAALAGSGKQLGYAGPTVIFE